MSDTALWVTLSASSFVLSGLAFIFAIDARHRSAMARRDTKAQWRMINSAMGRNAERRRTDEHRIPVNGSGGR